MALFAFLPYRIAPLFADHMELVSRWWNGPSTVPLEGKALLYGLPSATIAYAMPLMPYLAAHWLTASDLVLRGSLFGIWAASLSLVFALGRTLGGRTAGWLALILVLPLFPVAWTGFGGLSWETTVYAFFVLLAANALVLSSRTPSIARDTVLGLSLGLGLLCRSSLFLFPAAYALFLVWRAPRGGRGRAIARGVVLVAVPLLLLAPWAWMNAKARGHLMLFEEGRANCNVVTGALGLVETLQNEDFAVVAQLRPEEQAHPYRWAVERILAHPLTYACAVVLRLLFLLKLVPWLIALGIAGLWWLREREEVRALGLFILYFVVIHIAMPVEARYFAPLWPLLAAAGAALLARGLGPGDARHPGTPRFIFNVNLAWACALGFACLMAVVRYPAALAQTEALSGTPPPPSSTDPWLWTREGGRRENAGEPCSAAVAYRRALDLSPSAGTALDYSRVSRRLLENRLVLAHPPAFGLEPQPQLLLVNLDAVEALERFAAGDSAEARASAMRLSRTLSAPACRPNSSPFEAVPIARLRELARGHAFRSLAASLGSRTDQERLVSRFRLYGLLDP